MAAVACALAAAAPPPEAAAQGRVPPGWPDESRGTQSGAFDRLFEQQPRLVVRPMAALLGDGTHERRLNARATWPAADTAPDFAVHLLAGLATGRDAYSRSGLRLDVGHALGPARFTGSAAVSAGFGEGPRQAVSLMLGGGLPPLRLEVRTTWLHGGQAGTARTLDPDTPPRPRSEDTFEGRYTDGEVHARHRLGPVGLRLTGGQRFGGEIGGTRRWLFGEADIPVWRRFGIVLAGGVRPDRADLAQPGGRFAQVGLRVAVRSARAREPVPLAEPRPAAPAVVPIEPDGYLVRLRVPGARSVELKGDVTDWSIVALHRSALDPDVWEATFHKPAGVYHVNIRVDGGEWAVPPGLVAVPDRFGGSVGVLDFPSPSKQEVNDAA
jgi:hypothetical protein